MACFCQWQTAALTLKWGLIGEGGLGNVWMYLKDTFWLDEVKGEFRRT